MGAELQSISNPPGPSPISSPTPSPGPALSPAPVSSPDSNSQRPAASPRVPPFFPIDSKNSTSEPPADELFSASPDSNSNVQADKKSASRKPVVIAVIVTASVTFVVAALFFLCFCKVCRTGTAGRRNDERPLLSLSLSDYSVGRFPTSLVTVIL